MFKIVHKDFWRGENLERIKYHWLELAEDYLRRKRTIEVTIDDKFILLWKQLDRYDEPLTSTEQEHLKLFEARMNKAVSYGYFLETPDLCAV